MTQSSPKGVPAIVAFPCSLSATVVSIGGLALFLAFASCISVPYPVGSTLRGYFYVNSEEVGVAGENGTVGDIQLNGTVDEVPSDSSSQVLVMSSGSPIVSDTEKTVDQYVDNHVVSSNLRKENEADTNNVSSNVTVDVRVDETLPPGRPNNSSIMDKDSNDTSTVPTSSDSEFDTMPDLSHLPMNATETSPVDSGCDLYHGNWVYDSAGPSYTNNTCPIMSQMQNCQGNGRPDKEYENWRWKPFQCELPRFDGRKFLELMRGKTLAFVGDSVARNQMESLVCLLWQVEVPIRHGSRKMQRWYFRSTSTWIVRIWSSWLVHRTTEKFAHAPEGVDKLFLDAPDEYFMEHIPSFDVVVLSSGHWFVKQSVYIQNNEIVGGQLWWPNTSQPVKVNNIEAFGISMETALTAMATHPDYAGLTIVRSFSPDHYEGGEWNSGGSCTGKVSPLAAGEVVENGFTNIMHLKQVEGFGVARKKATNKSRMEMMDITEGFGYRHDGHPGPYRSTDPNKVTKRGRDGKPPPQDCLHWCLPGPIDTWNELLLEIITRDFEGNRSFSA